MRFFLQSCSSWQDFNWYSASRGSFCDSWASWTAEPWYWCIFSR